MTIEIHTDVPDTSNIDISTSASTPALNLNVPTAQTPNVDTDVIIGPKGDKGDKGDTGDSGVRISTTEPTDPVVNVWLNPNGTQGKTSQLINDGDGTSPFATESYVDLNGGKIDKIQKNGVDLPIVAKTVNVSVPTKTSDITNDSGYITSSYHDNTKQDVISDLSTIRSNATDGKSAYTTIQTYGDVVTHNVSEFATSAQGAKADTALQPNDNITQLTNNADYQNSTQVNTAITSNIINDVTHTDTNKSLSAKMGKELQDQITNLKQRGRYLSIWNCTTGLATTEPTVNPYTYKAGDYFIIGIVGVTNYKPNGATYDKTIPSTTVETGSVQVNDTYYYDGTSWSLLHTEQPTVAFSTLAGSPYDNANLTTALNEKVTGNNAITGATKTKITYDSKGLVTGGADLQASDIPDLSATYYLASNPNGYITSSAITGKENTSNKVTSISSSSTNTQYPSAKCVYDIVGDIETLLQGLR